MSLTGKQLRAAGLVAEDTQTDDQIAATLGINRKTLTRWRQEPEFTAEVGRLRVIIAAAVEAEGIANRQNRVAALNDRWQRMQRVIAARAEEHQDVPGGLTGLLVREVKLVKLYDAGEREVDEDLESQPHGGALKRRHASDVLDPLKQSVEVAEYAVDTGLLKELREHEKQAAQELGQWTEKRTTELSGKDGGPIQVKGDFDFDQYAGLFQQLGLAGAESGVPPADGAGPEIT